MLCNSGPDLRQEKAVVKLLVGRQVDGMLIVPQEHRSCEELRVYTEQVPRSSSARICGTNPSAV